MTTVMQGKNISFGYPRQALTLQNVQFYLAKGSVAAFIGPSGAGKTTLLQCMGGLQLGYTGSIVCDGVDIRQLHGTDVAKSVGFVFQQHHLFPHLSALHNCMFALTHNLHMGKAEAQEKSQKVLEALHIETLALKYPGELSGGQQQRVAIARALLLQPKVLLLDEPTASLDPLSKERLGSLLLELQQTTGTTIAFSTHDMGFVEQCADQIYCVEAGSVKITPRP
jgi:ABC-type polar amino acid transport system ATPase subunit